MCILVAVKPDVFVLPQLMLLYGEKQIVSITSLLLLVFDGENIAMGR